MIFIRSFKELCHTLFVTIQSLGCSHQHGILSWIIGHILRRYLQNSWEEPILIFFVQNNFVTDQLSNRLGDENDSNTAIFNLCVKELLNLFYSILRSDKVVLRHIPMDVLFSLAKSCKEETSNGRFVGNHRNDQSLFDVRNSSWHICQIYN